MDTIEPLATPSAPAAAGPYSPAVRAGDWIICSGQIGLDPATGELSAEEIRQALRNMAGVVHDCGCTWADVAKVTLFVSTPDATSMAAINDAYEKTLGEHRPARSTVGVAWLPKNATFEIEAWIYKPENPDAKEAEA
jgi:2-iminobutanoate/2-iminopropanoate deaminase